MRTTINEYVICKKSRMIPGTGVNHLCRCAWSDIEERWRVSEVVRGVYTSKKLLPSLFNSNVMVTRDRARYIIKRQERRLQRKEESVIVEEVPLRRSRCRAL